jgi:uncharacterized protein (DUF58 family)
MSVVAAQPRSRFLDLKALAAVAHLRFATPRRIEGSYSGRHRSRQQGGAAEFVDYREYSGGEDLRRLDWKVLARTGKAFIRLHQDETNLCCTIVLDASNSMRFGAHGGRDRSKLEYAQYLATALTQIIHRQQDQVGLAVISDALGETLVPGGTASHVARVQALIETIETRPQTNLSQGLRDLFVRLTRRGVLLVMSDFLIDDLDATFAALRLFRSRNFEVIVLHLVHPDEERLPEGIAFRFEGMENDGRADCSPAELRQAYEKRFESHAATVRQSALAAGCDYYRVSTSVPYMQTLGKFLVERTA